MSDTALAIAGAIVISISAAIFWLIYIAKLVTEVRGDGLYVHFSPLARQNVLRFTEISRCEVRTYRPIKEYGGWGIRYGGLGRRGRRNKALTISGNRGVQLELSNGNRLLIGSQRPNELLDAIQAETR